MYNINIGKIMGVFMAQKGKTGLAVAKLKTTVQDTCTEIVSYWNKPAKGKFVPYKEILNLGVGGMGQQMVLYFLGYLGFGAGNLLFGATLGIRPVHLQLMAMIQTIVNIFFFIIRGKIVDNTRTKLGRFRPYIAVMGVPLAILGAVFVFLDFNTMTYMQRLYACFGFGIAIGMISPMFTDTYNELASVMTPNSNERTIVFMVNSLVYSIAPTIIYLFVPMLSDLTGGFTNINTYRYIIAPIAILGVGLNLFTALGCKERVVSSKSYVQKIGAWQGVKEIFRNKYWWLRTISSWFTFLVAATGVVFQWLYVYGTQDMVSFGILNTVLGTAATVAMVLTPIMLNKLGNRKMLLCHYGLSFIFVMMMMVTLKVAGLFFVFLYINTLITQFSIVYSPAQNSEMKDYQQYLSGRRMDFTFGIAGQIGLPITIATGYVIPLVYESFGLTTNYDILYDPMVRTSIFNILFILAMVGIAMNFALFLFYDLSREKHRNYIKVLRYRALLEDVSAGNVNNELIKHTVEGVREAYEYYNTPIPNSKEEKLAIKTSKELPKTTDEEKKIRKAAIKEAKSIYRKNKRLAMEIKASKIMIDEINKYENPIVMKQLEDARKLTAIPVHELVNIKNDILKEAKAIEKGDKTQNEYRSGAIKQSRAILKMVKKIKKRYTGGGIKELTLERIENAYDMPQNTKEEVKAKRKEIKAAEKEMFKYNQTLIPYKKALDLCKGYEIKDNFAIVEKMYEDACIEVAKQNHADMVKAHKEKEDKKKELDALRRKKIDKLPEGKREVKLRKYEKTSARREAIWQALNQKQIDKINEEQKLVDEIIAKHSKDDNADSGKED